MGTLIFYSNDPAILPRVSSNARGAESWSGLRVDQLSEEQIEQLFDEKEEFIMAYEDALPRTIDRKSVV